MVVNHLVDFDIKNLKKAPSFKCQSQGQSKNQHGCQSSYEGPGQNQFLKKSNQSNTKKFFFSETNCITKIT